MSKNLGHNGVRVINASNCYIGTSLSVQEGTQNFQNRHSYLSQIFGLIY